MAAHCSAYDPCSPFENVVEKMKITDSSYFGGVSIHFSTYISLFRHGGSNKTRGVQ